MIKSFARKIVATLLAGQLRRLRQKHEIKIVAVVGSVGKTSTKFAISNVLSQMYRIRFQEGNYNDLVTVPLIFFGEELPSLTNPFAWAKTLARNERQIKGDYPYDIVVVELGTDAPGQIAEFAQMFEADLAVITAIAPEHMEFFGTLDAVAAEELSVGGFSKQLLLNTDLCDPKYRNDVTAVTYGIDNDAVYQLVNLQFQKDHYVFTAQKRGQSWFSAQHASISRAQLYSLLAAASVADIMGMNADEITAGLTKIQSVSGRMQLLRGVEDTLIIDDTYNASPDAVKSALDTLYHLEAPQRIALLGNMNELGDYSETAHREIGVYCDPAKVDFVVTLARDANEFTALEAEAKGCKIIRTSSPQEAADKIKEVLKPGAVILAKGSQNGVYAEEAVKQLLADPADASKLVRQSESWLQRKATQFSVQNP